MFFADNWNLLKDKKFTKIIIIGSHNSCSSYIDNNNPIISDNIYLTKISNFPKFLQDEAIDLKTFCDNFAKCQNKTITEQFIEFNVRSFDIRVCKSENNKLYTHHTFLGKEFSEILKEFSELLSLYPKEIIELKIKWTDVNQKGLTNDVLKELLKDENGLINLIIQNSSIVFSKNLENSEKTIEEYVNENKRIFIYLDENVSDPYVFGHLSNFSGKYIDTNDTDLKIMKIKEELDNYDGNFFELNFFLTPQITDYLSLTKKRCSCLCLKTKKGSSSSLLQLDQKLPKSLIESFGKDNMKKVHVVSVDFVERKLELIENVINENSLFF